jgi:hypothetical protein
LALRRAMDALTQALDPLLAAATPTTCSSGGDVTMAETVRLLVPVAIHMDSAGIADTLCKEAAVVVC